MQEPQETEAADDPFDLARFVGAQEWVYDAALNELKNGHKRTHWMWFIFPQIAGLGSSAMSRRYAIQDAEEARAYLAHPLLGAHLRECAEAVMAVEGRSASDIFNTPDDVKLQSSMTLFAQVDGQDSMFARVLRKYFGGKADDETLSRLAKAEAYREVSSRLAALLDGERDGLANCANTAALLYHSLPDLNWAGFYYLRGDELVLGPFQGKIACVRIGLGRGVCGTAAQKMRTIVVPDVHAFPGHIACDSASRSEIVLPLVSEGRLLGVLDLDSPALERFDDQDAFGLGATVDLLTSHSDWGFLPERKDDDD